MIKRMALQTSILLLFLIEERRGKGKIQAK
jgi:hypothetical protein